MVQALQQSITFEEFNEWLPASSECRYELHRGVIVVVSTNWQDNYALKLIDYEALGIQEYWVADYAALGGRLHIGFPKQPTFSVYSLIDREDEVRRFRKAECVISPTFSELNLAVDRVFAAE